MTFIETHLVFLVHIRRHLLENTGNFLSGVVVYHSQHAGCYGNVKLGHAQHFLFHVKYISAKIDARNCKKKNI